jgi:hypothetical protein
MKKVRREGFEPPMPFRATGLQPACLTNRRSTQNYKIVLKYKQKSSRADTQILTTVFGG